MSGGRRRSIEAIARQDALSWRQRNPNAKCGFGGAKDDPAPCSKPPREGGYLCETHAAIVGRITRGRPRHVPRQPGAVVTRFVAAAPRSKPKRQPKPKAPQAPKLCTHPDCELELPTRKHRYCPAHAAESKAAACRVSQLRRAERVLGPAPLCAWEGCERPVDDRRRRFCAAHADERAAA